jgi:hypothetical protein
MSVAPDRPGAPVASVTPLTPQIRVSPLRGGGEIAAQGTDLALAAATPASPRRLPVEPLSSAPEPADLARLSPEREEPPLPDEARDVEARASAAPTAPREAPEPGVLHVRFTRGADTSRIVWAMEELSAMLKQRPGATRVVFHIPQQGGATLPMEVRLGVAYDAELLADVNRRVGEGLVRLEIAPGARTP